MPKATKRLGRGLEALLPSLASEQETGTVEVPLSQIEPNPYQPRLDFDPASLEELAQSIREHGVIQPVVVRRRAPDRYELVVGERRLRAAKLAGLQTIPAIVGDFSEGQMMELAVVENLQREDLNPIEEAQAYQTLIEEFGLTQEQLAQRIGKSRPHISNTLRLLNLPEKLQHLVRQGKLSAGHARALLGISSAAEQETLAERIIRQRLSVRQTEELVRQAAQSAGKVSRQARSQSDAQRDAELLLLEDQLRQALGTSVRIRTGKKKGTIIIEFYGPDDLARIFERIVGIEEPL